VIFASNVKGYEDLSTSVRGAEVAKIVAAIAVAKKESRLVEASPAFRLEFFKGAQRLGTVTNSDLIFWIGQTPYSDTTGNLRSLLEKARAEHPASFRNVTIKELPFEAPPLNRLR